MRKIYYIIAFIIVFIITMTGCKAVSRERYDNEIEIADEEFNAGSISNFNDDTGIEITFWRPSAEIFETRWYDQVLHEFNQLYKGRIHVNVEDISRGTSFGYEDTINVAAASGSLPDVLAVDGPNISYYAYANILLPLDSYFTKDELSDFIPSIIVQGLYKNKLYAVGTNESTVVLFYNKKLLNKAGIQPPAAFQDAWTWEAFFEISKKLTKNGIYGTNLINDKGEWMTYCFEQFWISNNTDIISEDGTKAEGYLNSPEGIEAGLFLKKMADNKLFNIKPLPTEFEEGKAATKLGGVWNIAKFKNYPELEWGITYFPYKLVKTSPSGSWAVGVSSVSKHPFEAVEFIKFLTGRENSMKYCQSVYTPPSRRSVYNDLPEYNKLPFSVIKDQAIKSANSRPRTPVYPILTKKFADAINDILNGGDVKSILDNMAREMDNEYRDFYSRSK